MQSRRAFLERYATHWATRAADRRRAGDERDLRIAAVFERHVASMQAELAILPPEPPPVATDDVTWRSPVFNVGGRFDPFAGTRRERMLASADVCARIGAHDAARAFRAHADAAAPSAPALARAPTDRRRRTGAWSGPAIVPPEPAAFAAGPQLGLFG